MPCCRPQRNKEGGCQLHGNGGPYEKSYFNSVRRLTRREVTEAKRLQMSNGLALQYSLKHGSNPVQVQGMRASRA